MNTYNEELKTEWKNKARWDFSSTELDEVADWFISKHTTYLSELRKKLKEIIEIEKEQEDFHAKHNQIYWAKTKQKLLVLLTLLDNDIQQ